MLKAPQIKHSHTAISTTAYKNIDAVGAEANVIHLLVVSNQLRLRCQCGNIPNGAGCVNTRRNDQTWRNCIPVKRGDGSSVLGGFRVRQQSQRGKLGGGRVSLVRGTSDRVRALERLGIR